MPDHLHLLVEGLNGDADLKNFVRVFKQQSAFMWRRTHEASLWQRGYFDRVLREEDDTIAVARYVLGNPIRAGMVSSPQQYPFLGSLAMDLEDLLDSVRRT